MIRASYTGVVFIFLIIQSIGFAALVWLSYREFKKLKSVISNVKEQSMIDIRSLVALINSKL